MCKARAYRSLTAPPPRAPHRERKAIIEIPDLQRIGASDPSLVPSDDAAWGAIGQHVWEIGSPGPIEPPPSTRTGLLLGVEPSLSPRRRIRAPLAETLPSPAPPPVVLDAQSRALIARLHNAGPTTQAATAAQLAEVIARLEHHIVADTALNQFTLRALIRRHLVHSEGESLDTLDAWIYDDVFATPRSDAWLGLLPRTDFTGLPGDGVVLPR